MEKLAFVLVLLCGRLLPGLQLEFLAESQLPHKMKFEKTTLGGLSGIYYDNKTGQMVGICDDRGKINEPRMYFFNVDLGKKEFKIKPVSVRFIRAANKKTPFEIMDMEGIAALALDRWLISSEGDNNHKPRIPPILFEVRGDGTWLQNHELPDKFIPEKTGLQKKGIANNFGPEGLSVSPSGKKFLVGIESPLVDEKKDMIRLIEYSIFAPDQLKPWTEYLYTLGSDIEKPGLLIHSGLSELIYINESEVLILERGLRFADNKLNFDSKIFWVDLKTTQKDKPLKKTLVLDLEDVRPHLKSQGPLENYEGMTWGPEIDGKRTLLLVSDDNFMRKQRTHFLAFMLKESK